MVGLQGAMGGLGTAERNAVSGLEKQKTNIENTYNEQKSIQREKAVKSIKDQLKGQIQRRGGLIKTLNGIDQQMNELKVKNAPQEYLDNLKKKKKMYQQALAESNKAIAYFQQAMEAQPRQIDSSIERQKKVQKSEIDERIKETRSSFEARRREMQSKMNSMSNKNMEAGKFKA